MAILDNAIWLTGAGGYAEDGSIVLSEGGNSTTVTATFTADAWDATQSGQAVSDFGAFGLTAPIEAVYGFSNPIENLQFDLQHVSASGTTYDDKFTLYLFDANGDLLPSSVVIAGLTGLTHHTVSVNPDGSVSIEADGEAGDNVTVTLTGPISSMRVVFEAGPDGTLSGGAGLSDLTFAIPAVPDYVVEGTAGNDLIDDAYLGDPEGDLIDANDAADGSQDDVVEAGAGNDTILSGAGADSIMADIGDDSVMAGEGYDTIFGGDGSDTLLGQDGNDNIFGDADNDELFGGLGDDSLTGGDGDDTLSGGAGNDTLTSGDGNDVLYGGDDNDVLTAGFGDDTLYGGDGDDDLEGLYGRDVIYGDAGNDHVFGRDGDDLIYGGTGNDSLIGSIGVDTIYGGEGDDLLAGSQGNDLIFGGSGNDLVFIGVPAPGDIDYEDEGIVHLDEGNDFLDGSDATLRFVGYGGDGNDLMNSGIGDDTLEGGAGYDTLSGAAGNDLLSGDADDDLVLAGTGEDTLDGGSGNDTLEAGEGNDVLIGGTGNDRMSGEAGDDTFKLTTGFGNDTILGGETAENVGDTLDSRAIATSVSVDLSAGVMGDPESGILTSGGDSASFSEIENIVLGSGGDSVIGSSGADNVATGAGADTVDGGAGDDRFDLGAADAAIDTVILGNGSGTDTILGFEAPIDNGDGTFTGLDMLDVSGLTDAGNDPVNVTDVVVTDSNGDGTGDAVLTFPNGESLILAGVLASAISDPAALVAMGIPPLAQVDGTSGADAMSAGYTDLEGDQVDGADGLDDLIYSYGGDDTIDAADGSDTVYGGNNNDFISGGAGADLLFGEEGADTLLGGTGADTLFGGDDRDLFFGGIGDVIDGGEGGDDVDTLNLSALGGDAMTNVIYGGGNNESGTVEVLDTGGNVVGNFSFSNIENVIPCFTPGTMILTNRGEVKVEDLKVGDRVLTRDSGYKSIRWTGTRVLTEGDLAERPRFNPIHIAAGALGHGLPERDMSVSPQHRMLMAGPKAQMLFGDYEVLVAATHLVNGADIVQKQLSSVTYIHILFDRHELVRADGTWTESFQPGDQTLGSMGQAQRDEILSLFPELETAEAFYPVSRLTLKSHEARVLLAH